MNREHPSITKYLRNLSRRLPHLNQTDKDDIAREIKEHILERWEADSQGAFDDESLHGVLGKMGMPESIAAQYCEQRGWAKPPKRHTLRNAILIGIAAVIALCIGGGYLSYRYILFPFFGLFRGSMVEVDDSGVRIFNDAISVNEDGVKIKGVLNIDAKEGGVTIDGKYGKLRRMNIMKLLNLSPAVQDSGTFSIPAKDVGKLDIEFISGKVVIAGGDVDAVSVKFSKKVYGSDIDKAKKILEQMKIEHEKDGSTIEIKGEDPLSDQLIYPDGIYGVAYDAEIKVPRSVAADIECKNCDLKVASIKGPLKLEAKYGKTEVDEIEGGANIDGKYGTVEAANIKGDVEADGKYGSIRLKNIGGSLLLDSKYGDAKISGVGSNFVTDAKYGTMRIDGVRGDITIDAKYGDVDLALSEGYGFELKGKSKYGNISCDFPTQKDGELIIAKIGDGSHALLVDSKFGSVDIDR